VLAAINQAGDTPNYRQGWAGFGERYGAVAADGVSNIMIGGAILPRFCTRIRATSIKARLKQVTRATCPRRSARLPRRQRALQPNYSSVAATSPPQLSPTPTIRRRIAAPDWSSKNVALSTGERMLGTWCKSSFLHKFASKPTQ